MIADGYAAEQEAAATGLTAEMAEQAEAVALATRSSAGGEATAFAALVAADEAAPFVTQLRLYLETVERRPRKVEEAHRWLASDRGRHRSLARVAAEHGHRAGAEWSSRRPPAPPAAPAPADEAPAN